MREVETAQPRLDALDVLIAHKVGLVDEKHVRDCAHRQGPESQRSEHEAASGRGSRRLGFLWST